MARTWIILIVAMALFAGWASVGLAGDFFEPGQQPSSEAVAYDALLCRPFGLAAIGFGAVAFVATLPGSIPSKNCKAAARAFVKEPTAWTFKRRLGTNSPRERYFFP